eukprot:NODE_731_length_1386_cov_2009.763650_g554_i0.p2 GENE.NODE_731_length_1386_cov_2009.763650_g554_i0~~NODE_731_length_1386_cov_2009.763650_g554_i0.p2  ORF type:complete len:401 (-),score=98.12 NODE_731_length_1386_cov_2009.763650_g554_i0:134-1336(-)
MSHRKFERPRHGSLGFLPRKRARRIRGRIRSFPKDDPSQPPHLTAFMAYKAGMTHVVRDLDKPGSKMHKKEVVQAVSVLDAPPMVVVGLVGLIKTVRGYRPLNCIFAQHLPQQFKRAQYKHWARARKKAFCHYAKKFTDPKAMRWYNRDISEIKKHCAFIRVIAVSQVDRCRIGQKKGHVMEIQINGGTISDKVDFAIKLFEQQIPVDAVFKESEMIDTIGVTRGHGFEGVVHRWGVTRLPRKTHKGLRKVACIGAWHPARVGFQVARAGQHGFHHRTEINKKIFKIGRAEKVDKANARCPTDLTDKTITPMGGFVRYGKVKNDFLLLKGTVAGPNKRVLTLRKSLRPQTTRESVEKIELKFIDTSTKYGHGRFQTSEEKNTFMGPRKKSVKAVKAAATA